MSTSSPHSSQTTLELDGQSVEFEPGETILQVAKRLGTEIPTLCWDERLSPAGACRLCLVEVEGTRLMQPACALKAQSDMSVHTQSERVQRNRRFILALHEADTGGTVAREHGAHKDTHGEEISPSKLKQLGDIYLGDGEHHSSSEAECSGESHAHSHELWPLVSSPREDRPDDQNPYVGFRADRCIACSLCTRYCDQIEGVSAITMAARGAKTTVSTADRLSLEDTTCEMCGGCISVCPTGAMYDKPALAYFEQGGKAYEELDAVRTTCNFCGVGCQLDLHVERTAEGNGEGRIAYVTPPEPGTTVNDGNLCVKGRFANDFVHHEDRLTTPLVRDASGALVPATWSEAIERAASGLRSVANRHGSDALAFISSSRCTVEENYLVQKMARAAYDTHNVHQCAAT